jgi:uncharacterized protein YjdB
MDEVLKAVFLLLLSSLVLAGTGCGTNTSSTPTSNPAKTLTTVAISPSPISIPPGGTQQLTATASYSDNSTANVSSQVAWVSANPALVTVSASGMATGVAAGSTTVTATLNSMSGSAQLTVPQPAKTLTSLAISPSNFSVAMGEAQQLTATATYSDNSTANMSGQVSWTSSSPGLATVSPAGLVTGVAAGSATITAALSGVNATTQVRVPSPLKTVASIAVAPANPTVVAGVTEQLTATATYSDNTTANVTAQVSWLSAKMAVATISSSGLVTGVAAGSATVTATLDGISASAQIIVKALSSIAISPANFTLIVGATQQLTATATYSDNSTANVSSQVSWLSSNVAFATLSASGLATGVASGSATVSAALNGVNGSTTATVNSSPGGVAVLMHHNDLAGDGANLNEVLLTPANVNTTNFGRKFALPVDGQIYAQPLYVPGLMVNGAAHNTVFAATQNDSVYAFDVDAGNQLWKVSLGTAVSNNDPEGVQPALGILSTPVIDANTNTMYVTAVTSGYVLKLHALDITTGAEKFGGPMTVKATVPGTGDGNLNGIVPLSAGCYQRTALKLANGRIYLGFGHCNHGWLLAYDATTLAQTAVFNTSPDGIGGTIWMGDAGPVVDPSGNLYVITADDIGSTAPGANDFPDAFLKLSPNLTVLDSFIPSNERYLEGNDADLGSGAPILMPTNNSGHPLELIGGGKDGRVFVIDRNNMGGYNAAGPDNVLQTVQTGTQQFDNIWGAPAFWNGTIFYHTERDVLKIYKWNASTGTMSSQPTSTGNYVYLNHGASPSISANGTSNGIVWDVDNSGYPGTGGSGGTPAILHAYDASNITRELYNSSLAPNGRDTAGHACKFSVPTVTDGKVFLPTCTELDIYGQLP